MKITLTSDFDEVKRVQNYFASTDAITIFNVMIRNEKKTATVRKQRFPGNIENGGINSRRQPSAELNRIAQLFQAVGTETLEYLERSPVVPENVARSICI